MFLVTDSIQPPFRTEIRPGHPVWADLQNATCSILREKIASGAGQGEIDLPKLLDTLRGIVSASHYHLSYLCCVSLFYDGLTALEVPRIITLRGSIAFFREWHAEAAPRGLVAFLPSPQGTQVFASDASAAVLIRLSF